MKQEYTVDYFIAKFKNTRDDKWCVGTLNDGRGNTCALGWCGFSEKGLSEEGMSLVGVMEPLLVGGIKYRATYYDNAPAMVSNGDHPNYQQPTPKKRILTALHDIKKMQEPEVPIQYENAIPEILKSIQNPTIETDVLIQPTFHVPHCL